MQQYGQFYVFLSLKRHLVLTKTKCPFYNLAHMYTKAFELTQPGSTGKCLRIERESTIKEKRERKRGRVRKHKLAICMVPALLGALHVAELHQDLSHYCQNNNSINVNTEQWNYRGSRWAAILLPRYNRPLSAGQHLSPSSDRKCEGAPVRRETPKSR